MVSHGLNWAAPAGHLLSPPPHPPALSSAPMQTLPYVWLSSEKRQKRSAHSLVAVMSWSSVRSTVAIHVPCALNATKSMRGCAVHPWSVRPVWLRVTTSI